MTPQQIQAIKQFMAKPEPYSGGCGCMGPQTIDIHAPRGKYGIQIGPREPLCPCMMRDVEEVEGQYYLISKEARELGYDYVATNIGPIGGPYTINSNGKPGFQPRQVKERFDVILTDVGHDKLAVLKLVRDLTGLGTVEAKRAMDGGIIKDAVHIFDAEGLIRKLEHAGAKVELKFAEKLTDVSFEVSEAFRAKNKEPITTQDSVQLATPGESGTV